MPLLRIGRGREGADGAPREPLRRHARPRQGRRSRQLAALQAKLLSNSEWVGDDLPETARAMHLGEMEPRPVHGQASAEEARSLIDEGVPLLPLPLAGRAARPSELIKRAPDAYSGLGRLRSSAG